MNDRLRSTRQELGNARIGDQPSSADHDQVISGHRHLTHQMRRDKHRPALRSESFQQRPNPLDSLRVEPVHRFIQHHCGAVPRAAPSRSPAVDPSRARTRPPACAQPHATPPDRSTDQRADASPMRLRERQQVVPRRTATVHRPRLEQRPNLVQRRRMIAIKLPVDRHAAPSRLVEPENQTHRRRLPRPVGTKKPRHDSWPHSKRKPIDRPLFAVVLGQLLGLDHCASKADEPKSSLTRAPQAGRGELNPSGGTRTEVRSRLRVIRAACARPGLVRQRRCRDRATRA